MSAKMEKEVLRTMLSHSSRASGIFCDKHKLDEVGRARNPRHQCKAASESMHL
jgi:hypothetical protein